MGRFKKIYLNENVSIRDAKAKAIGLTYRGWGIWEHTITKIHYAWDDSKQEFVSFDKNISIKNELFSTKSDLFKEVLSEIYKIHNINHHKNVKFNIIQNHGDVLYKFFGFNVDGVTKDNYIIINSDIKNKEIIVIHEIGHIIDRSFGMDNLLVTMSNDTNNILNEWNEQLLKTDNHNRLKNIIDTKKFESNGIELDAPPELISACQDLILPYEMFARFYEQYISNKTKNNKIKTQFKGRLYDIVIGFYNDDDYLKLENIFENVLKKVGWK
jgi:hypothetical protein